MNSEGFRLFDGKNPNKKVKFDLSCIDPKTVILIVPNKDGVLVVEGSNPKFAGLILGNLSGVLKSFEGSVVGSAGFLDLIDTPINYSGAANKFVRVKADSSGLEFVTEIGGGGGEGGMVFVKRDNLTADDFSIANLIRNDTWQTLDLSTIVPEGVMLVLLRIINILPNNTDAISWDNGGVTNHAGCHDCYNMGTSPLHVSSLIFLACDTNRRIMYKIKNTRVVGSVTVRGWWM